MFRGVAVLSDTKNFRNHQGHGMIHDLENVGATELLFLTVEFLDSENPPLEPKRENSASQD
jgi:hypothetical protein